MRLNYACPGCFSGPYLSRFNKHACHVRLDIRMSRRDSPPSVNVVPVKGMAEILLFVSVAPYKPGFVLQPFHIGCVSLLLGMSNTAL